MEPSEYFCLQADVTRLTAELTKARQVCAALKDKEEGWKEQILAEKKKKKSETGTPAKTGTLSGYDKRPAALVRKYGELYAQTRLETLESLDKLTELNDHDDLKSKLLFSVIVVRPRQHNPPSKHSTYSLSAFLPLSVGDGGDQEGPGEEDPPGAAQHHALLLSLLRGGSRGPGARVRHHGLPPQGD